MHSCLFRGTVRHRRFAPVDNQFSYNVFMMYLDLSELPGVLDQFFGWSATRPALAWFRRKDHFGDPERSLDECVRSEVKRLTGVSPAGPIRLLTNLRYFGYVINPVSYYFCFDETESKVEYILAEVQNTPWGERHCYVLCDPIRDSSDDRGQPINAKTFHVSPFMPMNMEYHWTISEPGDRLSIHIENHFTSVDSEQAQSHSLAAQKSHRPFDVTMILQREPLTQQNLNRILLRHPCMTAKVVLAIYWQALRLWWKKTPFYSHPRHRSPPLDSAISEPSSAIIPS